MNPSQLPQRKVLPAGNAFKVPNFNIAEDIRGLKKSLSDHLRFTLARDNRTATTRDWWVAACLTVRDRVLERFIATQEIHYKLNTKRVYYFSVEYLIGRLLTNNLYNTGLLEPMKKAFEELGLDYTTIEDQESDMGLGNGGLGRLAACFLDSLATLDYPALGYGIYYEFGLFKQDIIKQYQFEKPDNWLQFGNPWGVIRPEYVQEIHLYGTVETRYNSTGDWQPAWVNTKTILGMPWDIPIVGYGASTVNFLRLWESRASEEFDFKVFSEGGYVEAVREKAVGETISKVLYPDDHTEMGKELRLVQQYFFVACSLKDIVRRFKKGNPNWDTFTDKVTMQLNDTHPTIAIVELMRILIDEEQFPWQKAWDLCVSVFGYTNHTLLPEALEKWSVVLFQKVLPRHLQIIYEINRRFLEEIIEKKWPNNSAKKATFSLIEEGSPKMIRMAYLATIGSHSINGVAALHTELLKKHLFSHFYELYPERFNNKTNGITQRRWLGASNHELAELITSKIGSGWTRNLMELRNLEPFIEDADFRNQFLTIKQNNKHRLATIIKNICGVSVNPNAIFDVQIKRIHEYKRQHLNLLNILTLYHNLLHNQSQDMQPRVFIFGGKAAPGYILAKEIIHAINAVGDCINNDERINGKLKVVFIPNYNVTLASEIIPAADVSEQISTAGKEASGTGNMKFALNGAVTVGTLDGANVEMLEEIGKENMFIFGLTVDEVYNLRKTYNSWDYYYKNNQLKAVLDWLGSDCFTPKEGCTLLPLRRSLLEGRDPFMVLADYQSYCDVQLQVDATYRDPHKWAKIALLNIARVGKFSSDRTIREYAQEIWKIEPLPMQSLCPALKKTS
jgi:starch phosphorylase